MDQNLQTFEGKLQTLGDKDLVEQIGLLFRREKRIGDAILIGLKEIKLRRLFAAMGYSSLFEMLVKHYHLSETASYQRVNALKLIESVPEAQEALFNGEVSLSNAALAQSFIQRSEKETKSPMSNEEKMNIIESIKGKTHREAHLTLAEINPVAILPTNKEKPLSKNHTQMQIVVDEETLALLKEIQELLSHTIPDGDYNAVLKYMGQNTVEILRKKKGRSTPTKKIKHGEDLGPKDYHVNSDLGSKMNYHVNSDFVLTSKPNSDSNACSSLKEKLFLKNNSTFTSSLPMQNTNFKGSKIATDASKHCVRSRYIPMETKRRVYARAEERCEFIGYDGYRCESRHQLEIDHVKAWSHGGKNDESNLRILCKSHNLYRMKNTHGFWFRNPDRDGQS